MKKYFVIKDGKFLWEDGEFYDAFVKSPCAVDEIVAKFHESSGCHIEYVEPEVWPQLYSGQQEVKEVKKRRTYIRCSGFALAEVLDRLYNTEHTYNVWVSLEDSDFLVSFEYTRNYERIEQRAQTCCLEKKEKAEDK